MQSIKKENDQKKEYLNRYRRYVQRIRRIEAEIDEIRQIKLYPSGGNNGMPHGSGQADLSGYAAELDRLERDLIKERYGRIRTYRDIAGRIRQLENENERDVLFYRYIKGMSWWEIAEKMAFSERQIYRIHGKALAHFMLPEERCQ